MCLYQFSKVANLVELTCTYMSYSTNDVMMTSSSFVWLITCPLKKDGCSAESPSCYSHFWNCQIAQFRVFAIAIIFLWLLQLVRLRNKFLIFHNFRQKNPKCQFSTKIWKNVFWRKIWKNDDFWKIIILFWHRTVLYRATNLQRLKPSNSKKLKIYLLLKTKFGATYDRYLSFSYGCPDRSSLRTVSGLVRTTIKGFYI